MNAYDVKNVRRNSRIQHPHKLDYIFADNLPPVACIPHLALVLLAGRTGATLLTLGTVFLVYQSGSIVSERSSLYKMLRCGLFQPETLLPYHARYRMCHTFHCWEETVVSGVQNLPAIRGILHERRHIHPCHRGGSWTSPRYRWIGLQPSNGRSLNQYRDRSDILFHCRWDGYGWP